MPSIWKFLWQMIRYAQRLYWVDTLLWLWIAGLPIVPGLLIQQFFDSLTEQSRHDDSYWLWIGLLLATGLARVVAIVIGRITKTQHRFLISGLVRHNLLLALLRRPGAELVTGGTQNQNTSPGEVLSYFRDDASQIEDNVVGTNEILAEAVFTVLALALMLRVHATMTLLVFLPLCTITVLVRRAEHRLKRYRYASRRATQQVAGFLGELFTNIQTIKVTSTETQLLHELKNRLDRRHHQMVRDRVFTAILNAGFENIVSLGTGLILLLASQSLGMQGTLTVGDFALFVYYLSFVTYFLGFLGNFLAVTQQSEVSFERMSKLVAADSNSPPHVLTYPHPLYLQPLVGPLPALPSQSMSPAVVPLKSLRIEGLTYHYPNSTAGITNISFTLKRGSLTIITGAIGTGKTTLLRVLLGLLPKQSGKIIWNDQEISDPANFLMPPQAAYTPQVPQLFSTSLRENLLLGFEVANMPAHLEQVITTAVFDRDLVDLPNGLNTTIGPQGMRLSGGQKQRAAAARMLLRQPELLVFDDLSSALDGETEQRLWKGLLSTPVNASRIGYLPTYLAISHRTAVLQKADQILLLEEGCLSFSGSFETFCQLHSYYLRVN